MPYGYGFAYMLGAQILFFIATIGLIIWFVKNHGILGIIGESQAF